MFATIQIIETRRARGIIATQNVHYLHIIGMAKQKINLGKAPNGTQSVERATMLLRVIASHNRVGLRLVDLCNATALRRPTVHRLMNCLVRERLIDRNPKTKNYHLGQLIYELGLTATPNTRLEEICRPNLNALAEATGDMVLLTLRSKFDAVCIDRQEGSFPIRTYTLEVGTRRPLGVGAGSLAILSALPEEEAAAVVEFNRTRLGEFNGLTTTKLQKMINLARQRGFAIHDGSVSGARAIGIALYDKAGTPYAGISVSAITSRMKEERWSEIAKLMRQQAELIRHNFS